MKESEFQREARLYLGQQPDLVVWRNAAGRAINVSFAELKKAVAEAPHGRFKNLLAGWMKRGMVPYGLALGSGDLIGIHSPSGRFVSIELKTEAGRLSEEQELFDALVRDRGGFSSVARTQADLELTMRALRVSSR